MEEVEKWRELPMLDGRYKISSFGRVYSRRGKSNGPYRELKPQNNSLGYMQVNLMDDNGIERKKYVHRLVASVFLPNPNKLSDVNHKDGNRANNKASNLEWMSHRDNVRHSIAVLGRKNFGAKPRRIKNTITGEEFESAKDAAAKYGISIGSIYNQINGRVKSVRGHTFCVVK